MGTDWGGSPQCTDTQSDRLDFKLESGKYGTTGETQNTNFIRNKSFKAFCSNSFYHGVFNSYQFYVGHLEDVAFDGNCTIIQSSRNSSSNTSSFPKSISGRILEQSKIPSLLRDNCFTNSWAF